MNLKTDVTRKQSTQNIPKNKHFLLPDTHRNVCELGAKKCLFFGNSFEIRLFAVLPYLVLQVYKNRTKWNCCCLYTNCFILTFLFSAHNLIKIFLFTIWDYIKPSRPNPERREKIKLNSYFHTSLRCLKRFY